MIELVCLTEGTYMYPFGRQSVIFIYQDIQKKQCRVKLCKIYNNRFMKFEDLLTKNLL